VIKLSGEASIGKDGQERIETTFDLQGEIGVLMREWAGMSVTFFEQIGKRVRQGIIPVSKVAMETLTASILRKHASLVKESKPAKKPRAARRKKA
jgi:hypothetical protein